MKDQAKANDKAKRRKGKDAKGQSGDARRVWPSQARLPT